MYQAVDLALAAERWELDSLFNPVINHICRSPFPEPDSLQLAAKLMLSDQAPHRLRAHLRAQLANYLSRSLQSSFPNTPDFATTALLQAFHSVNDLVPALEMAARQAPILPLLHGLIGGLENIDGDVLRRYVHALPVSAAGLNRILSCDITISRWAPRAIRIVTSVATEATRDVARAAIPLRLGKSTSLELAGIFISFSAAFDIQGIAVSVCVRDSTEKVSIEDWKFANIEICHISCVCGLNSFSGYGKPLVLERGVNAASQSGVLRFDGKGKDWMTDHGDCAETILSISVELLTKRAAISIRDQISLGVDESKRRGSLNKWNEANFKSF